MPADYNTGRDLHVDAVLSNIVVGRRPEGFVADQLVPIVPVSKQSDIYYKTDHKQFRQYAADLTRRAPGTEARKVKFAVSSDTYYAKNYALGADWPVEDEVNADQVLQWATQHSELVTDRLLIDYEIRVANMANTAGNIASTISVATGWSNLTGSRPLDDLAALAEAFRLGTGLKPNVLLYPEEVGTLLRRNDQIRDVLFGDRGGLATDAQIANLVNIPKVLVPSILVNSAGDGETLIGSGELHGAWAKKVWMFHVKNLGGMKIDTWAQGFRWTSPLFGTPWAIQRYPFDAKKKIYGIEASYYQDEKIVSRDLAWAIDSVA
jgi:hypothetical protein